MWFIEIRKCYDIQISRPPVFFTVDSTLDHNQIWGRGWTCCSPYLYLLGNEANLSTFMYIFLIQISYPLILISKLDQFICFCAVDKLEEKRGWTYCSPINEKYDYKFMYIYVNLQLCSEIYVNLWRAHFPPSHLLICFCVMDKFEEGRGWTYCSPCLYDCKLGKFMACTFHILSYLLLR